MAKDSIDTAQEFFEHTIKILGENQLYRLIFGEFPIDKDSAEKVRRSMRMYDEARPLLDELGNLFEKKTKKGK